MKRTNMRSRFLATLLSLAMVLSLVPMAAFAAEKSLSVVPKQITNQSSKGEEYSETLNVGDTLKINLGNNSYSNRTYTVGQSGDSGVIDISGLRNGSITVSRNQTGTVTLTAQKTGTATITCSYSDWGASYKATITVTVAKPVEDVKITKDSQVVTELPLYVGDEVSLTAQITPADAGATATWASGDKSVATVDNTGKVKAVKAGETTITATAGGKSASVKVTVSNVAVTGVTLEEETIIVAKGGTATLNYKVLPENATNQTVNFSMPNNQTIASVSSNGTVRGHNIGETTVTVTTAEGNFKATCTVKVIQPATSVTLDQDRIDLKVGKEQILVATVKPDDATDKSVIWTSSNEEIAKVDENGKVTALKAGTATITATAVGTTNVKDTCVVNVSNVDAVSISIMSAFELEEKQTQKLSVTFDPVDTTIQTVQWESSNPDVATVDEDGTVTAVKVGEATITATWKNGNTITNIKDECKVTVKPISVKSIALNKTVLGLDVNQTEKLVATITPEDAANADLTWVSTDPTVAAVDQEGTVKALKAGKTTIIVTAGGYNAQCEVSVGKPVEKITLDKEELTLAFEGKATLTATVAPEDAGNKEILWSSSNTAIAVVSETGEITAKSVKGEVTITAASKTNPEVKAECKVTVTDAIPVTDLALNKATLILQVGASETLTVTFEPAEATNQNVTWTSTNPEIATVDETGKVTALKDGKALIYAVAEEDNTIYDACEVSVGTFANPFVDVKESDYFYNPVLWAVTKGITQGTSDTTFSPEMTCTRAQTVTFLWRAAGSPEPASYVNPFNDVKVGDYFYKAVLWAVQNGITNGTSANTFSPDATVTRGQTVTFQWRAAGEPRAIKVNPFVDVSADQYYYKAVLWAVQNGITNGTTDTTFSPDAGCTRGQIVTFLYRDMAE